MIPKNGGTGTARHTTMAAPRVPWLRGWARGGQRALFCFVFSDTLATTSHPLPREKRMKKDGETMGRDGDSREKRERKIERDSLFLMMLVLVGEWCGGSTSKVTRRRS